MNDCRLFVAEKNRLFIMKFWLFIISLIILFKKTKASSTTKSAWLASRKDGVNLPAEHVRVVDDMAGNLFECRVDGCKLRTRSHGKTYTTPKKSDMKKHLLTSHNIGFRWTGRATTRQLNHVRFQQGLLGEQKPGRGLHCCGETSSWQPF